MYENTKTKPVLRRIDLVYPELSYKIIGTLFEVQKQIGSGYSEKYYQKAIATEFQKNRIVFKEQVSTPLTYKGISLGRYLLDFLIEDKIILEIKKDRPFSRKNIEQVLNYLKIKNLKLGLLANFTKTGVLYKRILNIN